MTKSTVTAIFCSDLHLSHKAPLIRMNESDWYEAQRRVLKQIVYFSHKNNEAPIFFAGDFFDKWNSLPELINMAIDEIGNSCWTAIPGQHDLPHHCLDEIKKSAYYTLDSQLFDQDEGHDFGVGRFPYETLPHSAEGAKCDIALIHRYCWRSGCSYTNPPGDQHVHQFRKDYYGFRYLVVGDNHQHFISDFPNQTVVNCGCLIRRSLNEIKYKPSISVLHEDGEVHRFKLYTDDDIIVSSEDEEDIRTAGKLLEGGKEWAQELNKLGTEELDFESLINSYMKQYTVRKKVKQFILQALETE